MADSLRLFVAIYPTEPVARALLDRARALRLPDHRLTPVRQVHLTVRFLGATTASAIPAIERDLERIADETLPFPLTIERLITLPRTRARLLAAVTDLPRPLASLIERAALLPGAPVSRGDPTPHLTLARFRRGLRARPINEPVEGSAFDAREIHLVRSELGPAGATHESMRIATLRGDDHQ